MIPIEKNIVVVDEQGNEYEATYPKRAKGLVADHLHNENDDFVEVAQQKYGYRGKKQAMELVEQMGGM